MKVIIKHGVVNYENKRYFKGDELNVSEHFYNCHIQRFEKVKKEKSKAVIVSNDTKGDTANEQKKEETKEKEIVKASTGKAPNKSKSKKAK